MNRIKLLSKEIADKIAAGEVIEEPLSVVKELVENSIDSGASQIVVEIKAGGKDYIRVTDNGSGINAEDIELTIKPHATSKIRFAEDLNNINSLGFRGEALASVFAVSKFKIITKTEDAKVGTCLFSDDSQNTNISTLAADNGTTVIVEELFYNLPARRKFLKSDNKEASAISEFLQRISLAYPSIKIRFINNGTIIFATPGRGDIYQTILTVYSPKDAKKLLKVDYKENNLSLKGYISSPMESRNNKRQQIFFVNGRLIRSSLLEKSISDAYSDKLFDGRYPSVYLFLEIDPSLIDVNIHPRKLDIKFYNEDYLYNFYINAIRRTLYNNETLDVETEDLRSNQFSSSNGSSKSLLSSDDKSNVFSNLRKQELNNKATSSVTENTFEPKEHDNSEIKKPYYYEPSFKENIVKPTQVQESIVDFDTKFSFQQLKVISQIFTTYILARDDDNFYIIDQHAAHERIMFEKLLRAFNKNADSSQLLLIPIIVDLSPAQTLIVPECSAILCELGFSMEEFGNNSFAIKEIPMCMSDSEAQDFISTFFDSAFEFQGRIQLKKNDIISKSCKSAVKAHDNLSIIEMTSLLSQLDECENPFSCPHGRPTFIKFSEYELEKMFKRK